MENPLLIAEAVFKVIEKGSERVTLLPFVENLSWQTIKINCRSRFNDKF